MFRLVVIATALGCSFACAGSYSAAPSSPTPSPTPDGASQAVTIPTGAEVLGDRAFAPDQVTIVPGTTVTWINTDSVAHTSTSNSSVWSSGSVAPGSRYSFTFETPGTFAYHCSIHPGMVGTVVVR
jgi:plastocyanin